MTLNEFMTKSGIPMELKGGPLVRHAIEMCMEDPDIVMEYLYQCVAKKHNLTRHCVERRMRNAVIKAYDSMDADLKTMIFLGKERVTTAHYLKTIAYFLSNDLI